MRVHFRGTLTIGSADNPTACLMGGYKALHSALCKCRSCMATGIDIQEKVSHSLQLPSYCESGYIHPNIHVFFCFCFFPVQREPSPAADQGNTRLPCRKPWWSVARTHRNYIWGEQPFHPQPLTIFPCCWWFIARYNARCFGGHTPVIFKTTVVIFDGREGTFCSWHTEWENPAVQLWATSNKQTSANQSNIFNFIWCLQTEAIRYVIAMNM